MKNWSILCALEFLASILVVIVSISLVSANIYVGDIYFTIPNAVYTINEQIEIIGYIYQANYTNNGTLVSASAVLQNALVNLTINNKNGTFYNNYTFTTDSAGAFYSRSNFYPSAKLINASSIAGDFKIRAEYKDANNSIWFSELEITVVNQTIDNLQVSSNKAIYNPSETIIVGAEAIKTIGDRIFHVSNVSVNGSLRNSSYYILSTFNCTTGTNGRCNVQVTAPSTYGNYILELNNFKAFGALSVIPFSSNIYMKDDLGKSLKNIYAIGEQGRVEVSIINASTSDIYSFSGYISDSAGNVVKSISSTQLQSNNSFTNSFLFTVDALTFSYGAYKAYVTISKTGDGSISSSTSFEVKDWALSISKKSANSGFEYEFSTFPNKTLRFEASPKYRINGSVISEINSTFFTTQIKDNLNNIISSSNASWNASCGKEGCYEISINSPINSGQYNFYVTLAFSGSIQTKSQIINVINGVLSAQSTDKDGNMKELFGANEYAYISLTAYNLTSSKFNLTDAEVLLVTYMNGSEFSYIQVNNSGLVNSTNSIYEWAWNATSQRIKVDVPKIGGLYNLAIFGNNRTLGTTAKIIVNPYDACITPKDTAGQVTSGYSYYVSQFKTTDTIYFELKITQANNPLGRATALNNSGNSSAGRGSVCNVDTTTKQVVSNATISVIEARNMESGALQSLNTTETSCQSSDNSGGYTCTVKPFSKWDGGTEIIKFNVQGQDGISSTIYGRFEARAFYLYGYSQTWQNSPSSNISLTVQLYEAGSNWWGSSGGLSGTITVKKVEYMGGDGEWLSSPVDSGYNLSNVNSSTITSGSGTISLPVSASPGGKWKSGNYRIIIQGTTSNGDTDYGYAWFGVKLWDVYGQPVECIQNNCNYKSYFNSKENITLYIKVSQAGDYSYNYQGGQSIGGNVSIGIKKIQDCRSWPCKELNTSEFTANTIRVNESSPWYWNANINNQSKYIIQINKTTGSWNTGYYSVILDVNGTDTGYAWFNTIAFYVEAQPTDNNGSNYVYSIRGNKPMYFNVTTTKSYKWLNNGVRYNLSDYINVTVDDVVLRTWDQTTYQSKEYNYPEDINITPLSINGSKLVNVTFNNGSWPAGYYWGELVLKNSQNESSSGWLWFNVQPFRAEISTSNYNIDSDQCINATINIYEPGWNANSFLYGNYSIISVYENIWTGAGNSKTNYTNYTSTSFNATRNVTFCPNTGGEWGSGSWGGYHYLNVLVKDNALNDTNTGWLSFRTVPFRVTWGSVSGGNSKLTNANAVVPANLTKYSTGANAVGNLTKIYQWRYDNFRSVKEEYNFSVGSCYSNISGQCTVNGTQNVTIYAPSNGWRVGYNYLNAIWTKTDNANSNIEDWGGIYIEGREAYNGYFSSSDVNGNWKYYFASNDNLTIKLYARDSSYNSVNVNVTNVQYAYSSDNCGGNWCRSYTSASWSLIGGGVQTSGGSAIISITPPSGGWTKGTYYIKASVSGSAGTATVVDGNAKIKDFVAPNITITAPINNATYTTRNISLSATTTENSRCSINIASYNTFNNWYCGGWNSTNSTNSTFTAQKIGACNTTLYSYNGSAYYNEYVSDNYRSTYNDTYSTYSSGSTGFTTGGRTHAYSLNLTNWRAQHYGLQINCYDDDYNYASELVAFKANVTT